MPRRIARVAAALDGDHAHRLRHCGVGHPRDSCGRLLERDPEALRQRRDDGARALPRQPDPAGERPRRIEQNRRPDVGRQLAETVRGALRGERVGHRRQNRRVPLARISWLATVGICLIAALLLLLNGYYGYAGVLLAVGASAAVNLL